jgi:hypothetical protein
MERYNEILWYLDMYMDDNYWTGTFRYSGHGWFWNHKYRHSLRSCKGSTRAIRREVHADFLIAGLDVDGDTQLHDKIIDEVLGETIYTKPRSKKMSKHDKTLQECVLTSKLD